MKTNLDFKFKTDASKEDGTWYEVAPGVRFKLRRMGGRNSHMTKQYSVAAYKPYARKVEAGLITPEEELELAIGLLANIIIVDWEGIIADDQPLTYSKENATKLLRSMPDLADKLSDFATDKDNYIETVGN